MTAASPSLTLRSNVTAADRTAVRTIVESTGMFNPAEVEIAVELVEVRLQRGLSSGYWFVFADSERSTAGYACYGPIAGTQASYDLYWIAVDKGWQVKGIGKRLLVESERAIGEAGGQRIYVETSSRAIYEPTRRFYDRAGYQIEAVFKDFYAPGDDKVVFVKRLS